MFSRAIGFAPNGTYWRLLRRIASSHLFAPKRIAAHETGRQLDCSVMEGFELLGSFNWSDYLPWLRFFYDPSGIVQRCEALVPRVRKLVKAIIDEHRYSTESKIVSDNADFVDVLLSLDGAEKLEENDMVAVLWEMIFRGTDTTALLTEWVMAELILYPKAVVKETLRVHPLGPLLSWARLSTTDVQLSNGMVVPSHTTTMVNMWAITHDPDVWENPLEFKPERFMEVEGGANVDVRGGDLRLAPFGAGRRVCPGKNLGLVTVMLWVAKLVQNFEWVQDKVHPVDLEEVLKLSCEMKNPLVVTAIHRNVPF
ncbi:cytochrome p450 78a7 [Nicotiana attenuata]|uniref:Cytochrome p450 78a7 n=1 Tax=Nicotiana attenuata TaxID=49451 RepID=A0A1J6IGT0_NICAT|nr:cytochrome p450 78a7 [Nicotiana attenuata]